MVVARECTRALAADYLRKTSRGWLGDRVTRLLVRLHMINLELRMLGFRMAVWAASVRRALRGGVPGARGEVEASV